MWSSSGTLLPAPSGLRAPGGLPGKPGQRSGLLREAGREAAQETRRD